MSVAAAIAPQPQLEISPFQQRVLIVPENCDLLLGGGRGGGKSFALALLLLRHAEQYRNRARMLYLRQSFPGVVDFEAIVREVFGLVYGRAASYNAAAHLWRLPGGATLSLDQFENANDFQKFQGKSFSLIVVDEAGQYPDPSPLDLLRSCLRAPLPMTPRMALAANPGGAGHGWLVRRHVYAAQPWAPYIEAKTGRRFVNAPSLFTDNTFLDRSGYKAQLDAATALDPELGRAWRDGDWSVARGAYFSAVLDQGRVMIEPCERADLVPPLGASPHRHFLQSRSATYRPGSLFLAHDFGVSAPSVTYVCGISPGVTLKGRFIPRDSLVLFDEVATNQPGSLERGMGYVVPRLADEIKAMCKRWGMPAEGVADDAIFNRTGSSSGSISSEFSRQGVYFRPAQKADRKTGWEKMRRLLLDAGKPDLPGLYVSRRCEYWWATVPVLARDPRKPDDVDSRAPDHAADACRYAIVGSAPPPAVTIGLYQTRR